MEVAAVLGEAEVRAVPYSAAEGVGCWEAALLIAVTTSR